jgi:hypothetical protein
MRSALLICLLLFCGCTVQKYFAPVKVIDSEEVTWVVSSVMANRKHQRYQRLKLEHSNVHYGVDGITSIHLEISSQEILEIDKARNLFVDFVEDFLRTVNSNPIISGQIPDYPFTANNLHIEINFESFYGIYCDPFYIGCICLSNGMVRYSAFDMKNEYWHSWHSRVEPYTKTRELSILERAADKQYDDEHKNTCPNYLHEYYQLQECKTTDIHGIM